MPDLRQRQTPDNAPLKKYGAHVNKDTSKAPPAGHGHLYSYAFLASLALASIVFFYPGSSILPESYVLCSREGSNIFTVDENNSRVECLAVHKSHFVGTGTLDEMNTELSRLLGVQTPTIRYVQEGSIVVPGLSDSHAHILEYGGSRQIPLESGRTVQDTVALVAKYVKSDPEILNDKSKFIEGWGWDHTSWPGEKLPTAEDLEDPVLKDRPIMLRGKDGHALWVSHKLLTMSGPFPETVEGGWISCDALGNPSGIFMDKAQDLLEKPVLTDDDLSKRFTATVRDALSVGLTSVHDAGLDPASLAYFKRQTQKGDLPIRVYGMTFFDQNKGYWGNKMKPTVGEGNGRLNARSVKIFADGALRTGGAALHEPYSDNPKTKGFMTTPPEVLNDVIPRYLRDGWQVNVHAIGDYANGKVLDAFEAALGGMNVTDLRPRLEHAQIMTKADMARVGKLGVIASIQPTHVISDMLYAEERLGPERVKGLYAFRSLIDNGARITLGSDFPVEDINPLAGFYAAITRLTPEGNSPHGPGGWFPEQRLTRTEALRGMTIDPAYASFTESVLGSIVPGKRADYVVLSQDIMSIPVDRILKTKVHATVLDGRPVCGHL